MFSENRKEYIQEIISSKVEDNEITNCIFYILVLKEKVRNTIVKLIERNGYEPYWYDSISGCWNLNDDWYELYNVEAAVEYCGVYPVNWSIDDVVLLEKLYNDRSIYIKVSWIKQNNDGSVEYIPNH